MNWINQLFAKKLTVTFLSDTTGKKIEKVKFSRKETQLIYEASRVTGISPEQIIREALESAVAKQ